MNLIVSYNWLLLVIRSQSYSSINKYNNIRTTINILLFGWEVKSNYNDIIYYMYRSLIRRNITSFSIIIFIILYVSVLMFKPAFIFKRDGTLREFGLGFRNKTVIPAWLLAIILAIISYLSVLYYLALPKLLH